MVWPQQQRHLCAAPKPSRGTRHEDPRVRDAMRDCERDHLPRGAGTVRDYVCTCSGDVENLDLPILVPCCPQLDGISSVTMVVSPRFTRACPSCVAELLHLRTTLGRGALGALGGATPA